MLQPNFDGSTGVSAKHEFGLEAFPLSIVGVMIGVTVGFVAIKLAKLGTKAKLA
ncbi:MAG: hypothetical protein H0V76_04880 [Blastocatellia bacterium]|nr:hypothetical protein [Blastocatellia bacterium]